MSRIATRRGKEAIIMSVAGAVTGWVLDEIAHRTFLKKRRR